MNISKNNIAEKIPFILIRSKRKTISLSVKPDGLIYVTAPKHISVKAIEGFILEKSSWIQKRQQYFIDNAEIFTQKQYQTGDIFYYLGEQHTLIVLRDIRDHIRIIGQNIHISTMNLDKNYIKSLLKRWYMVRAKEVLQQRFKICLSYASDIIPIKHNGAFKIRSMRSRWGSCSYMGHITLGMELVCTPLASIDYVILHELCHLLEHNHSKKFYALQCLVMPDWKKHKDILQNIGRSCLIW